MNHNSQNLNQIQRITSKWIRISMIYHMNLHLMSGRTMTWEKNLCQICVSKKFIPSNLSNQRCFFTRFPPAPQNDIGQAPHHRSLGTSQHTDTAWGLPQNVQKEMATKVFILKHLVFFIFPANVIFCLLFFFFWQIYANFKNQCKSSWCFQPIWKILVKIGIFPEVRGENKKYLKPPVLSNAPCWCCDSHHLEMRNCSHLQISIIWRFFTPRHASP